MRLITFVVVASLSCLTAATAGQQASAPQAPPVIRSRIIVVPIDVRVLDRDGRPVTGLTQDDFVVLEDGVPQDIRHFEAHRFTPDPTLADAPPALRRPSDAASAAPANRRLFLLMAGRGRHQAVSKYLDELERFVADLLPQDQAAFMAWNRATGFTSDHARLRTVIAAYRDRHEKIEAGLRAWFGDGLRAVYGSKEIPPRIQQQIDEVFAVGAELRPRALMESPAIDAQRAEARAAGDDILRNEIVTARPSALTGSDSLPDLRAELTANLAGTSFDEFAARYSSVFQDLGNLYAAIDYLRFLDGEKHLVYLTEEGVFVPGQRGNRRLAAVASDARIALNVVQTGGVAGAPPPRVVMLEDRSKLIMSPVPASGTVFNQTFAMQDLRDVAEGTGGQLATFQHADRAFDRLRDALGSQYVLGYAPSRDAVDGRFRRIEVRVRRPDATVQYRRGYFASPVTVPLDRREFVTFSRLRAAAGYGSRITDIKVDIERAATSSDRKTLEIVLKIDISRLSFVQEGGLRVASLDVSLHAANTDLGTVGASVSVLELKLTSEAYQRALEDGARVAMQLPVTAGPRNLKVVVYDYGADLLGTATRRFGT